MKNNTKIDKQMLPFNSTYEPNTKTRQRAFNQIKLIPIVDYKSGKKEMMIEVFPSNCEIYLTLNMISSAMTNIKLHFQDIRWENRNQRFLKMKLLTTLRTMILALG